uniref:Ig-like domain-containing protein n=1 Tax=Erpetoichthys calabaricus TaxID=27687 RepID=A0A8C4X658_ERPCA
PTQHFGVALDSMGYLKVLPAPGLKGPMRVTAAVGKKVVMTCEYAKKYKDSKKYWCKTNPKRCFYQSHYYQQIVHDDKWNYLFTLQIPWVEVTDAGSYECLIQNSRNAFLFFKVELAVIDYPIFTEPKNVTEYRECTMIIIHPSFKISTSMAMVPVCHIPGRTQQYGQI